MELANQQGVTTLILRQLAICACLFFIMCSSITQAATNNTNLSVSVSVPPQVSLSSGQINFGTSNQPGTTRNASGTFQLTVSAGYAYRITLDAGLHGSTTRRLTSNTGHFRSYSLYQDAAHSRQWGDALYANTYPAGQPLAGAGSGIAQVFTVYASSPGQSRTAEPPGTYTDIVTITVHY